jgi:hypothetical protein
MVDRPALFSPGFAQAQNHHFVSQMRGGNDSLSMGIDIPLFQEISLKIGEPLEDQKRYPTARLRKGFMLLDRGQDLAEEAVGFGVPVLKRGLQTIFPGQVDLTWQKQSLIWEVTAHYRLNLVEKITRGEGDPVGNKIFYAVKDFLAELIRRFPLFRSLLTTLSSTLRKIFQWETTYMDGDVSIEVKVSSIIEEQTGKISVDIDLSRLPPDITEVVVMNEQGARAFDLYRDSSGNDLQKEEIGCWDEVIADSAWFESKSHRVAFKLTQVKGARLFRGRELIGSRLAWAGFGYSFPASLQKFSYELEIERLA